jgi:hypothetical protein
MAPLPLESTSQPDATEGTPNRLAQAPLPASPFCHGTFSCLCPRA